MKDSKKKQIKFKPKHVSKLRVAGQEGISHHTPRSEENNTRQTTLEEFFYTAREGAKDRNVR